MSSVSCPVKFVKGDIIAPRDKSISHRALIIGSMALGETRIEGLLEGEDVLRTWNILKQLGVSIQRKNKHVVVHGCGIGGLFSPKSVLDCGNSGTSARLLCGVLAGHPFRSILTGDSSLCSRPMERVTKPLENLGATFNTTDGHLPVVIHGTTMPMPLDLSIDTPSAQVKTALLLAGMTSPGVSRITEATATRDHTERMLHFLDVPIRVDKTEKGTVIDIEGQKDFVGRLITIAGDISSSAFMIGVAACLDDSHIMVRNLCINPNRTGFLRVLRHMGCILKEHNVREISGETCCDIEVIPAPLKAVRVPASMAPSMIDEYPMLSVVAACAEGTTILEGLGELKHKESNRFTSIINMLRANGVTVIAQGDSLIIKGCKGKPLGGGYVSCHDDHRLAMAGLAFGCLSEKEVRVDSANMIKTSFPSFFSDMKALGAHIFSLQDNDISYSKG